MTICSDCATNPHLRERIELEGLHASCPFCKKNKPKVVSLPHLATIISDAIQQHFEFNPQRYFFRDEDIEYTHPYGDPLETVVEEMLGQDVPFFDELLEAIAETSDYDVKNGEPDFFEGGALYAPIPWDYTQDYFNVHWYQLIEELKHQRRFFSHSVHEFFDSLFKSVEKIKAWNEKNSIAQPVVEYYYPGVIMYRARIVEPGEVQNVINEPFKIVGPAPRNKARAGRMNPEGVVALYCANEKETAIAELRPAIGNLTAVIAMTPTSPLRLLNFARLERAMDEGWGAYLATDYDTVYNTRAFLRRLHNLISQPVVPGRESEYLITQTMAEYLGHVFKPNFDGIIFKSVQHSGGTNAVIFSEKGELDNSVDIFPVGYVSDSVTFHETRQVVYKHQLMELTYSSKSGTSLRPQESIKDYQIGKLFEAPSDEESDLD